MLSKQKGNFGENITELYLKKNGHEIIHRNFNSKYGEIDIIAKKDNYIIFIEVKYRSSSDMISISQKQVSRIKNSAMIYIETNNISDIPRFDAAIIVNKKLHYIENAFV